MTMKDDLRQEYLFAQLIERDADLKETLEKINNTLAKLVEERQLPKTISPDEVAAMFRVDTRTVRNWISANKIPYLRANGSVVFVLSEILEWARAQAGTSRRTADKGASMALPGQRPLLGKGSYGS
ncbi:MAG TPA: helix-turn-helix domain-containing protein [Blastocatellia bacterium]|nr:helix-turn-helix domain-containing protein [Blastocatellia bacterium]